MGDQPKKIGVTIGSSKNRPFPKSPRIHKKRHLPGLDPVDLSPPSAAVFALPWLELASDWSFFGSNGPPMDRNNGTFDPCEMRYHGPGQSLSSNISMTRRTSGRRSLGFNWRLGIFANGLEMARVSESLHTPNETNENNEIGA